MYMNNIYFTSINVSGVISLLPKVCNLQTH